MQNMSNRKIFQNSFLPWDICINILSFCSVLSCPFSTDKYIYTHMTYYKNKNINHNSYHYMSYKCNIIDMHCIQYYLIHIIMIHDCNMYLYIDVYNNHNNSHKHVSDAYKTLEYVPHYAYCNICLHLVHFGLCQYSTV